MRRHPLARIPFIFLCTAAMLLSMVSFVFADVGPKPFVDITFEGLAPDHVYVATLLGDTEAYGPYSVPETGEGTGTAEEKAAFKAFFEYQDPDGYLFWGNLDKIYDNTFKWGYYPPNHFKVALYDATAKQLLISTAVPRYAFECYYTAKPGADGVLLVTSVPAYEKNINSFFIRLAATILIELLIALIFGYYRAREMKVIVAVNIVTQALLNLAMTVLDYNLGGVVWITYMPALELGVIVFEGLIYYDKLAVSGKTRAKVKAILYAVIANLASAIAGLYIGLFISIL
ncbi:MAG: hypothetical protein IJH90_03290 [Mogibacterium sp.]|nr:hypothetical protein [Mogibacterium sp.]